MSAAAHGTELVVEVDSPVHRLAPQCKVAATVLFTLIVALTPKGVWWPYLIDAAVLGAVVALARVPPWTLIRRLVVEIPFLLFVLLLPFVATGPTTRVAGIALSVDGLESAASITTKATFGLLATGVLAATTPLSEVITGLERLRVPRVFTAVASFMVRYIEVLVAEFARMRTARSCRAGSPGLFARLRDVAACAGALFVRGFERGERVYLAMVSRGYSGALPSGVDGAPAEAGAWAAALLIPLVAGVGTGWGVWA